MVIWATKRHEVFDILEKKCNFALRNNMARIVNVERKI